MKRALVRWCGVLALVAVLAACASETTPASLQFSLSENGTLGYEADVDEDGVVTFTITTRQMLFRSRAGDPGRSLTSYRIVYRDGAGNAVNGGDDLQIGAMSVYVPAGIQCTTPDEVVGCTLASEGAVFGPGPLVTSQQYSLLPGEIASAHFAAGAPVEWHALIRFEGVDARGVEFTTTDYRVALSPPN